MKSDKHLQLMRTLGGVSALPDFAKVDLLGGKFPSMAEVIKTGIDDASTLPSGDEPDAVIYQGAAKFLRTLADRIEAVIVQSQAAQQAHAVSAN